MTAFGGSRRLDQDFIVADMNAELPVRDNGELKVASEGANIIRVPGDPSGILSEEPGSLAAASRGLVRATLGMLPDIRPDGAAYHDWHRALVKVFTSAAGEFDYPHGMELVDGFQPGADLFAQGYFSTQVRKLAPTVATDTTLADLRGIEIADTHPALNNSQNGHGKGHITGPSLWVFDGKIPGNLGYNSAVAGARNAWAAMFGHMSHGQVDAINMFVYPGNPAFDKMPGGVQWGPSWKLQDVSRPQVEGADSRDKLVDSLHRAANAARGRFDALTSASAKVVTYVETGDRRKPVTLHSFDLDQASDRQALKGSGVLATRLF